MLFRSWPALLRYATIWNVCTRNFWFFYFWRWKLLLFNTLLHPLRPAAAVVIFAGNGGEAPRAHRARGGQARLLEELWRLRRAGKCAVGWFFGGAIAVGAKNFTSIKRSSCFPLLGRRKVSSAKNSATCITEVEEYAPSMRKINIQCKPAKE